MNRHPGRHGKFPCGRNLVLAPRTRQNTGNAIRLATSPELLLLRSLLRSSLLPAGQENMQREDRGGLQPHESKLVLPIYPVH